MKKRSAITLLSLVLLIGSSCATVRHWTAGQDSFDQGLALFNQGKYEAASRYFEDATQENPNFAQAYFYLGRAYVNQSRWRAAIQPLRTAFRLSPRESQQEIMSLLTDAVFAAALNEFKLGEDRSAPLQPKNML